MLSPVAIGAVNPGIVSLNHVTLTLEKSRWDRLYLSSINWLTVNVEKQPVAWKYFFVWNTGARKSGNTWVGEPAVVI